MGVNAEEKEQFRKDRKLTRKDKEREEQQLKEKTEKLKKIVKANKTVITANKRVTKENKKLIKKGKKQKPLQSEKPLQSVWYKAGDSEAHTEVQKVRCFPLRLVHSKEKGINGEVEVNFPKAQIINGSIEKITHTVPLSHIHLPVSTGWSLWRRRRLARAEVYPTPVGLNAQDD